VAVDASGRQAADRERERLHERLSQAERMESIGRLAGGVAHDFNNMLGAILGHTELALGNLSPADPLHADLVEIRAAADRSADLTRQLLAFARRQTAAPRVLDLNATVASLLNMLRRLIGEGIDLVWVPGEAAGAVRIDPSQVDQILVNLCVNARDAIRDTGRITIATGTLTADGPFCAAHPGAAPGAYVTLAVGDTGGGMDDATRAHLFEPFFTTKTAGLGTGLGLATVYGIVQQNLGFITVDSEVGRGSVFTIHLPRQAATDAAAAVAAPAVQAEPGHETILLVEDEPAILRMTETMLTRQGYRVLPAGTPGEAMRIAREHGGHIHLVVTDVIMPEMNGRDLATALLALYPDLKRLFMSGYTADVIAHHGVLEPGIHFIQKPFSMRQLGEEVRAALDGR
jgi:nitrogen-specific signal transduction histidine kinase